MREAQSQKETESGVTQIGSNKSTSASQKQKHEKFNFSMFFEEYKGVAHLEALEMLSRQSSVTIEMLSLGKPTYTEDTKEKLDYLEYLFDSNKLSDDFEVDQDEEFAIKLPNCQEDFEILISNKEKIFNIEHFEFLLNEYSRRSSLKIIIDRVLGAFRSTSYICMEELTPDELVI